MAMPIEFAKSLRWIGWFLIGVAVLSLGAMGLILVTGEGHADPGAVVIPFVFGGAGFGCRYAAARIEGKDGPEWIVIGAWVFKLTGAACVLGGLILVFEDPGGFALMVFGAVFIGAGVLAKRLFATPEGKKRILIPQSTVSYRSDQGTSVRQTTSALLYVDEDADEAEIEAAKASWKARQIADRPDWVAGRIREEGKRTAVWRRIGAGLWTLVTAGLVVAASITGELGLWLAAAGGAVFAGGFGYFAIRDHLHSRKFADSHFVVPLPALLGARLEGEIETGVAPAQNPRTGFTLVLECEHRWEESLGRGEEAETRIRSKTLWRDKKPVRGAMRAGKRGLILPVGFDLPGDGQPTSLGASRDGIRWRLTASAEMEGLDYEAVFVFPVVATPGEDVPTA